MSTTKNSPSPRKYGFFLLVAGVLLVALALRVWGSAFGLPYEYHVDENQYVRQAATMGAEGLDPADWFNPPFFKYLLLAEYGSFYILGRLIGWYQSAADFGTKLIVDPTYLYLLARWTSALMGTLTVWLTYLIGKEAYNRNVGLCSAEILAVCFLPVREAHFAVNDAAAAMWIALALFISLQILKTSSRRWYILAGIVLGLGFATKYHTLSMMVPYLIAFWYAWRVKRLPVKISMPALFVLSALISFLIVSPYVLISFNNFFGDISKLFLSGNRDFEGWQLDPVGGFVFYLKTLIWGLTWPLFIACLAGGVKAILQRKPADIILLSYPLAVFIYLGSQQMYFARFMLPIIPPLVILASAVLFAISEKVHGDLRRQRTVLVLLVLIVILPPLLASLRLDLLLSRTDTRTLAKRWIETNIPANTSIALDWQFHCPQLSTAEKQVAGSPKTYTVWYSSFPSGKGLSDHPISWYEQNGYKYLVTCSYVYQIPLADEDEDYLRQLFYASLETDLKPVFSVSAGNTDAEPQFIFDEMYGPAVSLWQRERPGPTINIYQLPAE